MGNTSIYKTEYGEMFHGKCESFLRSWRKKNDMKINLILTSPPFPLNRAKKYGNYNGKEYLEWIGSLAKLFNGVLADDGSLVIEMGNAWEKGLPVHSTLPIEALLKLKEEGNFYLCQEFIHYNPSTLPAPVEWVNKKRIRVKDSFTRIWWLSRNAYPKADNKKVLVEYSKQMQKLLKRKDYNCGKRPSEYVIGTESFCKDNGGAIPANVIIASNTVSNDNYLEYCKDNNHIIHPARMSIEIPRFFIRFLTDENDIILDPFGGSNTTGAAAEELHRHWISIEAEREYIEGSRGRFQTEQSRSIRIGKKVL